MERCDGYEVDSLDNGTTWHLMPPDMIIEKDTILHMQYSCPLLKFLNLSMRKN